MIIRNSVDLLGFFHKKNTTTERWYGARAFSFRDIGCEFRFFFRTHSPAPWKIFPVKWDLYNILGGGFRCFFIFAPTRGDDPI